MSAPDRFKSSRLDGRSSADVLLEHVKTGEPGHLYSYEELVEVFQTGSSRHWTTEAVRAVAASVYSRLLREQQRALVCVRGVGYRLALANEHTSVALARKRRSDVQLRKGLQTLQHVAWHELDPTHRKIHEGTLMVVSAMYANQQALERRQRAVEQAVAGLANRVEELAQQKT